MQDSYLFSLVWFGFSACYRYPSLNCHVSKTEMGPDRKSSQENLLSPVSSRKGVFCRTVCFIIWPLPWRASVRKPQPCNGGGSHRLFSLTALPQGQPYCRKCTTAWRKLKLWLCSHSTRKGGPQEPESVGKTLERKVLEKEIF